MDRRDALKNGFLIFGYTVTAGTLTEILSGCKSKPDGSWQPSLFSEKQMNFMAEFAETILPKTKTPGAKDVNLDRFADQFLFKLSDSDSKETFMKNIDDLQKQCKAKNGKKFVDCSPEERNSFVADLEKIPFEVVRSVWGMPLKKDPPPLPFYRELKGMLILGYFSSEAVGKNVLRYDPVPGKFQADIPLSEAPVLSFE